MSQSNITKSNAELEFTNGKIGWLFAKYGIPSGICLLLIGIQTVIDGYFVSNYAGENAFAGVSIAMPIYVFMAALIVVVGIGCQAQIGINMGKADYQNANNTLTSGFTALIGIVTIISALVLLFSHTIVKLLGANDLLFEYSRSYLVALTPFFPLLAVLFIGDYKLKATGYPYKGMLIIGFSIIINIILDYIFIAKLELGATGAGLATGLSYAIGALIVLPYLFARNQTIAVMKGRFNWNIVGKILYNGSSEGISELSSGITIFLFNISMMKYAGAEGVAVFTAINYIIYLVITVFVGLSDGIIPIISYNYGAALIKRTIKMMRTNMLINLILGILSFCFILFFSEYIITLFFENTPENRNIIVMALNGSKICAVAFLFNGLNIAASSFFTALGDAKLSVIVSLLRGLVFISIGIYLLPKVWGIDGIWIAIPLAEIMTFLIAIVLVRTKIKVLKHIA